MSLSLSFSLSLSIFPRISPSNSSIPILTRNSQIFPHIRRSKINGIPSSSASSVISNSRVFSTISSLKQQIKFKSIHSTTLSFNSSSNWISSFNSAAAAVAANRILIDRSRSRTSSFSSSSNSFTIKFPSSNHFRCRFFASSASSASSRSDANSTSASASESDSKASSFFSWSTLKTELPKPFPTSETISFRRFPLQNLFAGLSELLFFCVALIGGFICVSAIQLAYNDGTLKQKKPRGSSDPITVDDRRSLFVIQMIGNLITFCLAIGIARVRSRRPGNFFHSLAAKQTNENSYKSPIWMKLLALGVGTVGTVSIVSGLMKYFRIYSIEDPYVPRVNNSMDPVVGVSIGIIGPITEELLFRQFLFARIVIQCGTIPALILSAIPFGILHFSVDSEKVIPATAAGFIIASIYRFTGSISVPILAHVINNSMASIASGAISPFNEFFNDSIETLILNNIFSSRQEVTKITEESLKSLEFDAKQLFSTLDIHKRGYLTDKEIFYLFSLDSDFSSVIGPGLSAINDATIPENYEYIKNLRKWIYDMKLNELLYPFMIFIMKLVIDEKLDKNHEIINSIENNSNYFNEFISIHSNNNNNNDTELIWKYYSNQYDFTELKSSSHQLIESNENFLHRSYIDENSSEFPNEITNTLIKFSSNSPKINNTMNDMKELNFIFGKWMGMCIEAYLASFKPNQLPNISENALRPWKNSLSKSDSTPIVATPIERRYSYEEFQSFLSRIHYFPAKYDRLMKNFSLVASGRLIHPFDFKLIHSINSIQSEKDNVVRT